MTGGNRKRFGGGGGRGGGKKYSGKGTAMRGAKNQGQFVRFSNTDPTKNVKGLMFTFSEQHTIASMREMMTWTSATVDLLFPDTAMQRKLLEDMEKLQEARAKHHSHEGYSVPSDNDAAAVGEGKNENVSREELKSRMMRGPNEGGEQKQQQQREEDDEDNDEDNDDNEEVEQEGDKEEEEEEAFSMFAPSVSKRPKASVVRKSMESPSKPTTTMTSTESATDVSNINGNSSSGSSSSDVLDAVSDSHDHNQVEKKSRNTDNEAGAGADADADVSVGATSCGNNNNNNASKDKDNDNQRPSTLLQPRVMELDLGLRGVGFLELRDPEVDVNVLWHHMMYNDVLRDGNVQTRFTTRLLPIATSCFSSVEAVDKAASELVTMVCHSHMKRGESFSVMLDRRTKNENMQRDDVILAVRKHAPSRDLGLVVDYKAPDVSFIVQVIGRATFLGFARGYEKLNKFNLQSLCERVLVERASGSAKTRYEQQGNEPAA